jgi:hypothetical protein
VPADPDLRRRNLAAYARFRLLFGLGAVILPLALFGLFRRQELRLRALADHGRQSTAIVEEVAQSLEITYTHYRYTVDGASYTWSVTRAEAPYAPGEPFVITYLPEVPSLSRPGVYTAARLGGELDLPFQHRMVAGMFLALAVGAALCHRGLRRLQSGEPTPAKPLLSPTGAGRLVAVLLLGAVLASNLDDKVHAVYVALFGEAPSGVPVTVLACVVQAVLFAPFFWVFPGLMSIARSAQDVSYTKIGIVRAVAQVGPDASPELRRARAVVIGGFVYFVILVAAWIAFTDSRGV